MTLLGLRFVDCDNVYAISSSVKGEGEMPTGAKRKTPSGTAFAHFHQPSVQLSHQHDRRLTVGQGRSARDRGMRRRAVTSLPGTVRH